MKKLSLFAIFCFSLLGSSCRADSDPRVVSELDLGKYAGHWFEIGHNPNFFQRNCERSSAEYTARPDGSIGVVNTCFRDNKPYSSIEGVATVVNAAEPAKLIVDFGFFRRGDYWVVALDKDYQWAVVSGPGKSSLFILARKAPMDPSLLSSILKALAAEGFDTSNIVFDKY